MKKFCIYFALTAFLVLNVACSNDDSHPRTASSISNAVTQGTWRITHFVDSGNDETTHFTGYDFTFAAANILTATNGTNTYPGTWSVASDDSNDDSPSIDYDFNIGFAAPADFTDLTEDWEIISQSSTEIELQHVSGGGGGTDYLTFHKV